MEAEAEADLAEAPAAEASEEAADLEADRADPCARITDLECRSFLALGFTAPDFTAADAWAVCSEFY